MQGSGCFSSCKKIFHLRGFHFDSSDNFVESQLLILCFHVYIFLPPTSAYDFCFWKSFQRGSLKIHLVFIEKKSVRRRTIQAQRKIGQDGKRERNTQTEKQAGRHTDETVQPTKPKHRCSLPVLPVLSGCVLSNLSLQSHSRG